MKQLAAIFVGALLSLTGAPAQAADNSDPGQPIEDAGDYRALRAAADAGDVSAMVRIGTLFDTGTTVPQDFAAALAWYRRAAEGGSLRAAFNTAAMYDNGRGTPVDRSMALRWYEAAAKRGHARAAYAAGVIYRDGDGVPPNRVAALHYFQLAAQGGLAAARSNLAALRPASPPVSAPRSLAEATGPSLSAAAGQPPRPAAAPVVGAARRADLVLLTLTRVPLTDRQVADLTGLLPSVAKDAREGGKTAQYFLGYAFEFGYGVRADPAQARAYYLRAAASRDPVVKGAAEQGVAATGGPSQRSTVVPPAPS